MTLSVSLYRSLTELFAGMSIVSFITVILGLMLITVEFFQPSHRFPTYCGSVLVALGIVVRLLAGGTTVMLFYMLFFCALIILSVHILMLCTQKREWLATSLALNLKRSMAAAEDGYAFLLGRQGIADTDIASGGTVTIDDTHYAAASDEPIAAGTAVRVVHVAGESGVVKVIGIYEE